MRGVSSTGALLVRGVLALCGRRLSSVPTSAAGLMRINHVAGLLDPISWPCSLADTPLRRLPGCAKGLHPTAKA